MIKLTISKLNLDTVNKTLNNTNSNANKKDATNLSGYFSMLNNLTDFTGTINDIATKIDEGHITIPALFGYKEKNANEKWTRNNKNFIQLQTLQIDIDNQEKINGEMVKYDINNPKHISIEDAKDKLKKLGLDYSIIYTTLSHNENQHKFRILFLLDNPIKDVDVAKQVYLNLGQTLKKVDIISDRQALEPIRIFYPGKVIEVKENSFLDISKLDKYIEPEKEPKKNKKVSPNSNIRINKIVIDKNSEIDKEPNRLICLETFLDYINANIIEFKEIDYANRYDEINKLINLMEILNVTEGERFKCIMPEHEDTNPSSYIYLKNNITVYHCFGCDTRMNSIQLIRKLFNLSEAQFLKILELKTNISIGSKHQKEVRDMVVYTLQYLINNKNGLKKDSEVIFKYLEKRRLLLLLELFYTSAITYVPTEPIYEKDNEIGVTYFITNEKLKELYNQRAGTNLTQANINLKINALVNLGFIEKIDLNLIKKSIRNNIIDWMKTSGVSRYPSMYYLKYITPEDLLNAEYIINLEKKVGVKARNQGKKQATIIQQNKAQEIYLQNRQKIDIESEKLYKEVIKYIKNIDENYFEFNELIKNIDKKRKYRKAYKEKQLEIYLTKLAMDGIIEKIKCSKANKIKYNIPDNFTHYQTVYVLIKK